jgi:phage terminase large subunit GpA-like protein
MKRKLQLFRPAEKLTVSQWADKYRKLSPEASEEAGKFETNRAPYQRGIMDVIHEPGIEGAVVIKSAQVGITEIVNNIVGYTIDIAPRSMLVVLPKDDLADDWSKERLSTMCRDTKRLRRKIEPANRRDGGNSIRHKKFEGGFLTIAGANSPSNLAGKPVPFVLCDEVDRFPASAGKEGDPVDLARKRNTTFFNKFIFLVSTPTVKRVSRIESGWQKSDQRRFFVPCPCCNQLQHLKWKNLKFKKADPAGARYQCENPKCEALLTDEQIKHAVKIAESVGGGWSATAPQNLANKIAGFHIWEIYSPWSSLEKIVRSFLEAKDFPDKLKVWQNTCLGETFEDEGASIEQSKLMDRVANETAYVEVDLHNPNQKPIVPRKVVLLTGSIDTQSKSLKTLVVGWAPGEECFTIDTREFPGDPSKGKVWEEAKAFFMDGFKHELGFDMDVERIFVDTGGHHTQQVYAFCKANEKYNFFAIRGASQPNKPIVGTYSKVGKVKVKLHVLGVDTAKDFLFGRLGIEDPGKGYIHFPRGFGFDNEWFEQLTAERYTIKFRNGIAFRFWENTRKNKENHALDLFVYAIAAFFHCKANLDRLAKKIESRIKAEPGSVQNNPNPNAPKPTTTGAGESPSAESEKSASIPPAGSEQKPEETPPEPVPGIATAVGSAKAIIRKPLRKGRNFATNWQRF